MTLFTDLLSDARAEKRFLAHLEPYDPATSGIRQVYLSSRGFTSEPTDSPANTYWEPRLKLAFSFTRSLFQSGRLSGRSVPGSGTIVLLNDDGGLDYLEALAWGGRRIRVYLGGADFDLADYGVIFDGTAQGISHSDTEVTVNLRDLSHIFDRELQTAKFAGTGTVEGTADLKDRLKPIAFGVCRNVAPVYLGPDAGRHLFALNDSAMVGVIAVYDRGAPLTYAATPAAGQYSVNLATGILTLGGAYNGPITAHVIGRRFATVTSASSHAVGTGSKTFTVAAGQRLAVGMRVRIARTADLAGISMDGLVTSYSGTALVVSVDDTRGSGTFADWTISPWGTIAGALRSAATSMGLTNAQIDDANLAALDAAQPATIGFWLPEGGNGLQVLDDLAGGAGCHWGFDRGGLFEGGRLEVPGSSVESYDQGSVISLERLSTEEPNYEFVVRFRKNWQVLSGDQLAGIAADVTFFGNEWRRVTATNATTQAIYPRSVSETIDSVFDDEAAALDEANRLLALFGQQRSYFRAVLKVQPLERELGQTVTLSHPRYGLTAGRALRIVDLTEDMDEFEVEMGLFG